jgi:thioredoxin
MSDVNLMITLTEKIFVDLVENGGGPVLVECWADWCMPCRALSPIIEELAQEFKGRVRFGRLNVDECKETASRLGIRGIPTLLFFSEGKKLNELVGNQPKDKVRNELFKIS